MNEQFNIFIHNFVKLYNTDIFSNISKCKSLLLDHAKGEYKNEIRLLLQALELGFYTAILNSNDLNFTRMTLIKQLQDEYFINEDISSILIDLLLLELRKFKTNNINPINIESHKNMVTAKTRNNNIIPSLNKNVNTNPITMLGSILQSGKSPRKLIEKKYIDNLKTIYIPAFNDYKKEMNKNNLECEYEKVTQFAIRFKFTFAWENDILRWYVGNFYPYYQIMLNNDSLIQTDSLAIKYSKKYYDIDNYTKENIVSDLSKVMEEIIEEMKKKKII